MYIFEKIHLFGISMITMDFFSFRHSLDINFDHQELWYMYVHSTCMCMVYETEIEVVSNGGDKFPCCTRPVNLSISGARLFHKE